MEVVRRILNTSTRLDWTEYVAPVLTEYMVRMKQAGYGEQYRKNTLLKALDIYDKMKNENDRGERPLNRPRNWQEGGRRSRRKDTTGPPGAGTLLLYLCLPHQMVNWQSH